MASKTKNLDERPYGNNTEAWHQEVSRSSECDSLGGHTKQSQKVEQNAPAVSHPHDPVVKRTLSVENRSKSYAAYNQVAAPSSGGHIPSGKNVDEGNGSNRPKGSPVRFTPRDVTVTNVQEHRDVMKVQANENQNPSSRRKALWGQ